MKASILYEALAAMETAQKVLVTGGSTDMQMAAYFPLLQAVVKLRLALDAENLSVTVERDEA